MTFSNIFLPWFVFFSSLIYTNTREMSGKDNRTAVRDKEIKTGKSTLFFFLAIDTRCANLGPSVVSRHYSLSACVCVCVFSANNCQCNKPVFQNHTLKQMRILGGRQTTAAKTSHPHTAVSFLSGGIYRLKKNPHRTAPGKFLSKQAIPD